MTMEIIRFYAYTAVFSREKGKKLSVTFPDLDVATSGENEQEAICSAFELLRCVLHDMREDKTEFPTPTHFFDVEVTENEQKVLIPVGLEEETDILPKELREEITGKTGMSEAEMQNLIDSYYTLDDIKGDLSPLNEEYESEEYERVSHICYYMREYLTKDLKVDMRIHDFHPYRGRYSYRSHWRKPELLERTDICTRQLHDLMDAFYQFMLRNEINISDVKNYFANYYWEIVYKYQLSRLLYREAEIIECEKFIETMKKQLDWMLEDEPRAVFYSNGFKRRQR